MNRPKRSTAKAINYAEPSDDDAHDPAPRQVLSASGVEAGREEENGTVADKPGKRRKVASKKRSSKRKVSSITARLPLELIEYILDFAAFLPKKSQCTLARCCRVSRSFRQLARSRLYSRLTFTFFGETHRNPHNWTVLSPQDFPLHSRLGKSPFRHKVQHLHLAWGDEVPMNSKYSVYKWLPCAGVDEDDLYEHEAYADSQPGDSDFEEEDKEDSVEWRLMRYLRGPFPQAPLGNRVECMTRVVEQYSRLEHLSVDHRVDWADQRRDIRLFEAVGGLKHLQVFQLPADPAASFWTGGVLTVLKKANTFPSLRQLVVVPATEDNAKEFAELEAECTQRGISLLFHED